MTFTLIETSVGALFIQLATTNFYWQLGETIGFSSAIGNLFIKRNLGHLPLLSGVIASSVFISKWYPEYVPEFPVSNLTTRDGIDPSIILSVAGLLVGLGTKLGAGCTSGHMLSGLSRLRLRSLVAVLFFSGSAILLNKYLDLGLYNGPGANYDLSFNTIWFGKNKGLLSLLAVSALQVYAILPKVSQNIKSDFYKAYIRAFSGFLFGVGLHVSGMVNVTKTIGFLAILDIEKFDPSLLMIMIFAVLPNIFIWRNIKKPLLSTNFQVSNSNELPLKFLIGNAIFGLGWGILGICPGPGLANTFHYGSIGIYLVSFVTGYGIGSII